MITRTVVYETQAGFDDGVRGFEAQGWAVRQIVPMPKLGASYLHESWRCVVVFEKHRNVTTNITPRPPFLGGGIQLQGQDVNE